MIKYGATLNYGAYCVLAYLGEGDLCSWMHFY